MYSHFPSSAARDSSSAGETAENKSRQVSTPYRTKKAKRSSLPPLAFAKFSNDIANKERSCDRAHSQKLHKNVHPR
jgi:hypothetical protein